MEARQCDVCPCIQKRGGAAEGGPWGARHAHSLDKWLHHSLHDVDALLNAARANQHRPPRLSGLAQQALDGGVAALQQLRQGGRRLARGTSHQRTPGSMALACTGAQH